MKCDLNLKSRQLESQLEEISSTIWNLAKKHEGDSRALLSLLRSLELLHRTIREEMFQESLPDTRNSLYHFLKEIDETGGWPYIQRMRLQDFLVHLQDETPLIAELKNLATGEEAIAPINGEEVQTPPN
ncbi:MAG: hypothetical protein QNJ54_03695 [Prochloraceae cyanobacterium]|nr:hypothetical protein [Prochloraceae cyanobacterium]